MIIQTVALSTGMTLEYLLTGPREAPALAFVHGLGPNLRQFLVQASHFVGPCRVLLISLRGHGGSSAARPPVPDAYTPRALAQDVEALCTQLGIEGLHFVGNSLGGLVGYELLDLGRPRLLSLTTFGTTAELHSSRLRVWTVVTAIRLLGVRGMAAVVARTGAKDRAVGAEVAKMYRNATKDALLLISRQIADYDYTERLRRAEVPLLLIQGELDEEINAVLGSTLAAIRESRRGAAVCLPGAGHFANLERPEAFNHVLKVFLAEVGS